MASWLKFFPRSVPRSPEELADRLVGPGHAFRVLDFVSKIRLRDDRNAWRFFLASLAVLRNQPLVLSLAIEQIQADHPRRDQSAPYQYRISVLGAIVVAVLHATESDVGGMLFHAPPCRSLDLLRIAVLLRDDAAAIDRLARHLAPNEVGHRRLLAHAVGAAWRAGRSPLVESLLHLLVASGGESPASEVEEILTDYTFRRSPRSAFAAETSTAPPVSPELATISGFLLDESPAERSHLSGPKYSRAERIALALMEGCESAPIDTVLRLAWGFEGAPFASRLLRD